MAVYSVYLPKAGAVRKIADRAVFVREGFSYRALALGPFWLAANRLWRPLFACFVAFALIGAAVAVWSLSLVSALLLVALMDWYLGCEGARMLGAKLERRQYRLADIVAGSKIDEVERRFFVRWQPSSNGAPGVSR